MNTPREFTAILTQMIGRRASLGLSPEDMDRALAVGPGWTSLIESGQSDPPISVLLALLKALNLPPEEAFSNLPLGALSGTLPRLFTWDSEESDLILRFPYGRYDATHRLRNVSSHNMDEVVSILRNGLANVIGTRDPSDASKAMTQAVTLTFLKAVSIWPKANPSDLWWFLVYRAFSDPFNHPAVNARLDFGQSWKRTGGWALEEILVRHYRETLEKSGIRMFIATDEEKSRMAARFEVVDRFEADKVDIFLAGITPEDRDKGFDKVFGVVHVKASFAERRTDDVPMSRELIHSGYVSPLCTMDCKSMPSAHPINRGELGAAMPTTGNRDTRSAKRKDIEEDGYFSACFSYNKNTVPTPDTQGAAARIYSCDFSDPNDEFTAFLVKAWANFQARGSVTQ